MDLNKLIGKIELKIIDMFKNDNTGHDIYHLKRVLNNAQKIQAKEGGDKLIISVAAILHDVHGLMGKEQKKFVHPRDSLDKIKEILSDIDLDEKTLNHILHCIEYHEEYAFSEEGITVTDIESLILQDADNLDAIGAIEIARNNMFCGNHNIPMYLPEIPLESETYDVSIHDPSMIHHFYTKLLKLKDNMNTETGKKLAQGKHEFMETYLKQFFAEWNGEK